MLNSRWFLLFMLFNFHVASSFGFDLHHLQPSLSSPSQKEKKKKEKKKKQTTLEKKRKENQMQNGWQSSTIEEFSVSMAWQIWFWIRARNSMFEQIPALEICHLCLVSCLLGSQNSFWRKLDVSSSWLWYWAH